MYVLSLCDNMSVTYFCFGWCGVWNVHQRFSMHMLDGSGFYSCHGEMNVHSKGFLHAATQSSHDAVKENTPHALWTHKVRKGWGQRCGWKILEITPTALSPFHTFCCWKCLAVTTHTHTSSVELLVNCLCDLKLHSYSGNVSPAVHQEWAFRWPQSETRAGLCWSQSCSWTVWLFWIVASASWFWIISLS